MTGMTLGSDPDSSGESRRQALPIRWLRAAAFTKKGRLYVVGAVLWVAVLAVGIFGVISGSSVPERGIVSLGSADAAVTVVEYADFR